MHSSMNRRQFIKTSAAAGAAMIYGRLPPKYTKSHVLTLSFDDGFKKSFYRITEIHQEYGLLACLNVIATGHLKEYPIQDDWIKKDMLGDFDDWNTLKSQGHEVMPHTWQHLNLTKIPLEQAKQNIDKCLSFFAENLEGYQANETVYNFAYNASTPELDNYVLERVPALRTGGWLVLKDSMANPLPIASPISLGCWGHGPDYCDQYIDQEVNKFLTSEGDWLILNLHGLDGEGWGPLSTNYLDSLLKRLVKIDHLGVLPTAEVLKKFS
ncbi:MAG: polysaccharide deacetylase family protein [Cyclobacteriaceae bacterium]